MNNFPRFCFAFALLLAPLSSGAAQTPQSRQAQAPKPDRAGAYYHAALGHLYAELAAQFGGRGEYLQKAIENYRLAVQHDPEASSLAEELAELYVQSGQLRSAVAEFEEAVRRNPEDVNARRILGRLYTARIREGQSTRMNEDMIKAAVQQYEKVVEKAPGDRDAWLMLGRLYKLLQNSPASERAFKKVLEIDEDNEDALTGLAMVYSDPRRHRFRKPGAQTRRREEPERAHPAGPRLRLRAAAPVQGSRRDLPQGARAEPGQPRPQARLRPVPVRRRRDGKGPAPSSRSCWRPNPTTCSHFCAFRRSAVSSRTTPARNSARSAAAATGPHEPGSPGHRGQPARGAGQAE